MRLLFASSEVYPYSKTGGLGDVLGALPGALARLGHEVLVVTPWYKGLRGGEPLWIGDVEVPFAGGSGPAGVGTSEQDGVRLAFVGHQDFDRDRIYGYPDDVRRFCRFTRALPQVADRLRFTPDIVHVHDWHSAYLPLVLQRGWHLPQGFSGLPSVLTIHNAQYQGISASDETLDWLRLPGELRDSSTFAAGSANALKTGSEFAHRITTVSPSYAQELLTAEFGYGLEDTFRRFSRKLVGIVNGIDTSEWDPSRDGHIPARYGPGDLSGKAQAKRALCERGGLKPERPLLAVVSRLAEQKGIDVFLKAAPALVEQGWSLFLLGTGEEHLEEMITSLSRSSPHVGSILRYDEGLAHMVYAGADALAIPSRFEPCGLSQLIAMRYGTIPIARATGGLRDTIEDGRTGFLFSRLDPQEITVSAGAALERFRSPRWSEMMRAAMDQDFSWTRSAGKYEELYGEIRRNA
jgi:starch synthase